MSKYIVKIHKPNSTKIAVEEFEKEDTAKRWAANAANNGYVVEPIEVKE